MSNDKRSDMLRKIEALMAKVRSAKESDSESVQAEAESALAMARNLMTKYRIEESELTGNRDAEILFDKVLVETGKSQRKGWHGQLAMCLAESVGTVGVYASRVGYKRAAMCFYGPAEDIALAAEMFSTMLKIIEEAAKKAVGGAYRGAGKDYCDGFVDGLRSAIRAEKQRQTANSHSSALVLQQEGVIRRQSEQWLSTKVKLQGGGQYRTRRTDAYSRGYAAGNAHGNPGSTKRISS